MYKKSDIFNRLLPAKLSTKKVQGSAYAPSNIALAKYWGKRNRELNLPTNGSLSVSLAHLGTQTTIKRSDDDKDYVVLNGQTQLPDSPFRQKVIAFCDLFRREQNIPLIINTHNSIPTAAGLASSASGFAALTLALADIFSLSLSAEALSALARMGSGSAARSLSHGFVRWHKGEQADGSDSIAQAIDIIWQDFRIALIEVDSGSKKVPSRDGMNHTTQTSPLYPQWPAQAERDVNVIHQAILDKDFTTLGQTAEYNALAMHATMLAARPSLNYWQAQTLTALAQIQQLRADNVEVYATIDAGPNVKILFLEQAIDEVQQALQPSVVINPFAEKYV